LLEEEEARRGPELRRRKAACEDVDVDGVRRIVVALEELEQGLLDVPEPAERVAELPGGGHVGLRRERGGGGGVRARLPARASGLHERTSSASPWASG
jgi:hypothetical protein